MSSMAAYATHLVLVTVVLAALAAQPAAAKASSKTAAPRNSTFSTCNSGSSRLRLANLEQLADGCRPAHSGAGAAVLDCFRSSKVTVKDCRVSIKPKSKGKSAKLPPVCKLLHAQGRLHGASNATVIGVLSESQYAKYIAEHPQELTGTTAASLQQQHLANLALLFGRAVLRSKSNCTKPAAAGSSSSDYQGRRHRTQRKGHPGPLPAPLPTAATNASTSAAAAPARAGGLPAPSPAAPPADAAAAADLAAANATAAGTAAASGTTAAAGASPTADTQPGQAAAVGAAAGTAPDTSTTASNASSTFAPTPAAAGAANASTAIAAGPAPEPPAPAAAPLVDAAKAPKPPSNSSSSSAAAGAGGRRLLLRQRRLQQQQRLRRILADAASDNAGPAPTPAEDDDYALDAPSAPAAAAANVEGSRTAARVNVEGSSAADMDASSLKFSTKPAVPAAAAAAVAPTPTEAAAAANDADGCKDEADTDVDVAAAAAAAAFVTGKAPAKLYRQGSSLILQTHASCQYQFVVTKNIGVMQPEASSVSSSSSSGSVAAAGSPSSRPHSKAAAAAGAQQGWYLPSWVVFTAVSVVMGGLVCFMAVRLYARVRERQDYAVLQTQDAPVELATGPFPSSAARPSQTGSTAAVVGQQCGRSDQQLQLPISSRAAGSRPDSRPGSSSGMKLNTAAAAAAGGVSSSGAAAAADDDLGDRDAASSQETDHGDSRQLLRGQARSDGSMPRSSSRGRSLSGRGAAAGKGR